MTITRPNRLSILAIVLAACSDGSVSAPERRSIIGGAAQIQTTKLATIEVANVEQLHDAVNDEANAGRTVVLAPGQYDLVPTHSDGSSRSNGGRLELQPDMELQGRHGHSALVVIDASRLPVASFRIATFLTGAIRMGRGSNALEWLTVRNAKNGAAAIETDLVSGSLARVRIAHVVAGGNQRGIDVRNLGPASAGRVLEAELTDNVLVGNLEGEGQGIRLMNTNGATGAVIRARLSRNDAYGNHVGCSAETINSNSASISIESHADRFDENGTGCAFMGGAAPTAPLFAEANLTRFEATGSSFQNNSGVPSDAFSSGGIVAIGGRANLAGHASNNRLEITLVGVRIGGNAIGDIVAWGALSPSAGPAGTNNSVMISLRGVSHGWTSVVTPSTPAEPAGTNTVTITP